MPVRDQMFRLFLNSWCIGVVERRKETSTMTLIPF
jgi:hypothetical protein